MKKSFFLLNKKKLLIVFAVLTITSATLFALPAVVAAGNNPVAQTIEFLQSILTSATTIESNLNKVKIQQVIEGPPIQYPEVERFSINCSQPWDLMAIYISTEGVDTGEFFTFGYYQFGSRIINARSVASEITVAEDSDVKDFAIFPSDMTGNGQSIISIPANVTIQAQRLAARYSFIEDTPAFSVSFKIVIQRPIDPNFSYNVVFGEP